MSQTPEERREDQVVSMLTEAVQLVGSSEHKPYFGAMAHHNMLLAYFDEHEPFTANTIRNGPPTVEQLTELIRKHRYMNSSEELAELILQELGAGS